MASHLGFRRRHPSSGDHPADAAAPPLDRPVTRQLLGVTRIVLGFVFLWAFLDKLFGLRYATQAGKGWIDGGSPTKGFLSNVAVGPFESMFHAWAGTWWANSLFMLALLGIGVALLAGVAMRIAAACGVLLMALMWVAEWPLDQHTSAGELSMSTNPLIDYHVVYALLLVLLALTAAGEYLGLGRLWSRLPIVRDHGWLR